MGRFLSYQTGLAVLGGLTAGLVVFDRGAISILSPFIVPELQLSNAQLGLATSIVALSWGVGSFLAGRLADATGRPKALMVAATLLFSLMSAATGLAGGIVGLVAARLLLGAAEGPVGVLSANLLIGASTPDRRGLNLGVSALFTVLIGIAVAPVAVVALATAFGWRGAFFATAVPGLVAAIALALCVRPDTRAAAVSATAPMARVPLSELLGERNVWLCALAGTLIAAGASLGPTFAPLFLVQARHYTPIEMGLVMSAFGVAAMVSALALPALSDRLGRKPVVALAFLGPAMPLGCLYWTGSAPGMAACFALAGLATGASIIMISIIPGESVGLRARGTALGLTVACVEIVGSFAAPSLAGLAADRFGLAAVFTIAVACMTVGGGLTLALKESAPRRAGLAAAEVAPAI